MENSTSTIVDHFIFSCVRTNYINLARLGILIQFNHDIRVIKLMVFDWEYCSQAQAPMFREESDLWCPL